MHEPNGTLRRFNSLSALRPRVTLAANQRDNRRAGILLIISRKIEDYAGIDDRAVAPLFFSEQATPVCCLSMRLCGERPLKSWALKANGGRL